MIKTSRKALNLLEKRDLKLFFLLLFMMLFAMIFETLSLGTLIPLINYFTDTNLLPVFDNKINYLVEQIGLQKENLLFALLIFIFFIFVIKNLFLLLFHWLETKIITFFRAKLSLRLFEKYLNEDYRFHLEKNSYEISANIIQESAIFGSYFLHFSMLLTEIFLITGLVVLLYIINPLTTTILTLFVLTLGTLFYFIFKKNVNSLGIQRKTKEKDKQNILQQGLSALKEIIIFKAQNFFIDRYRTETMNVAKVHHKFAFISKLPKLWFETFSILLIALVVLSNNFIGVKENELLAYLGIGVIALIKLLPSTNKIISAIQYINFSQKAIESLHQEIFSSYHKSHEKRYKSVKFKNKIQIKKLEYKLPNSNNFLLKNLNLEIKKNEKIGIMGETGSGKSTLINIISGLVKPSNGKIEIDNEDLNELNYNWIDHIGYVGQTPILFEGSIANNIAFGFEKKDINKTKLEKVIEISGLKNYISKQTDGVNTIIREHGKNLSGGERQRICIARAIYKNPDIIIFDESTSALDLDTEKKVISSIESASKDKTIIFISHKKSALGICDRVFELKNKTLIEITGN